MVRPKAAWSPARCSWNALASVKPEADSKITNWPLRTRAAIEASQPPAPGKTSTPVVSRPASAFAKPARDSGSAQAKQVGPHCPQGARGAGPSVRSTRAWPRVADLVERLADRLPVVVAREQVRVHALVAAAAAMAHHVFHVDARDAGAVDLDPLLGEAGVVDVADVEVQAHPGARHVVEEQLELARAHQEALLGAAVLAADLDPGPGRRLGQPLQPLHRARIDLLVRRLLGDQARDDQDGVRAEDLRGLDLARDVPHRLLAHPRIAGGEGPIPVEGVGDVGDQESRVVDLAPQLAHVRVLGLELEPGAGAEPQLDAVVAGLLDESEALVEAPLLQDHVVADGFLHESAIVSPTRGGWQGGVPRGRVPCERRPPCSPPTSCRPSSTWPRISSTATWTRGAPTPPRSSAPTATSPTATWPSW